MKNSKNLLKYILLLIVELVVFSLFEDKYNCYNEFALFIKYNTRKKNKISWQKYKEFHSFSLFTGICSQIFSFFIFSGIEYLRLHLLV